MMDLLQPKRKKRKRRRRRRKKKIVKKEEVKITEPDGTKIEEKKVEIREEKKEDIKEVKKEEKKEGHGPPPFPLPGAPVGGELVKKTTTTTTIVDPPDHHHRHQDLAVMVPRPLSEREIRREIRALEAERQALKLERAADYRLGAAERLRDGDWEIIERDDRKKDIYRVERDRRVRSRSRGVPNPKVVGIAMAALS